MGKFIALRFGRLYPLHVVVLAAFLVTHVAIISFAPGLAHGQEAPDSYSAASFFASLTMTQPFFGRDTTFWNAPAWSIAAEFWTYVIFAFLFRSAKRWVVPFALCASLISAGMLFEFSAARYHFLNDYHDGALFRAVLGFGLGVAVFHVHRAAGEMRGRMLFWTVVEAAAVALAAISVAIAGGTALELLVPPIFCIVIFVFSYEKGAVSALLNTRPFRALGTYSYSIYMIHFFLLYKVVGVLKLAERMFPGFAAISIHNGKEAVGIGELSGDFASIAFLLFVIGCASITYRWIERPAREWSRRRVLGDHPPRSIRIAEANAPAL